MIIHGPVGQLEADVQGEGRGGAVAVLCHPHPQMGGSMHDGVLGIVAGVLETHGIGRVRFNFRGVGASEGAYNDGIGEVDDVAAVLDYARTTYEPAQLLLVGYSFGAAMAWKAAASCELDALLLVAPPFGRMDFDGTASVSRLDAVVGDGDAFVDLEAASTFLADNEGAELRVIEGADHFFSGRADALIAAVDAAISSPTG